MLVIAKLDRLARNARFLLSVVEGSGEAGVVFCDLSTVPAGPVGKILVTQMAAVAELEAGLISQRTRAALAVAKARGVRLGNPSPTLATAEMAAAARQARSRRVAARAADVMAIVRQVRAEGARRLSKYLCLDAHVEAIMNGRKRLSQSKPRPTGEGLVQAPRTVAPIIASTPATSAKTAAMNPARPRIVTIQVRL